MKKKQKFRAIEQYQILMYEMEWNVGIYMIFFFFVKLAVGWSNSRYELNLTVGSNFGSNLAIRSSYNR